MTETKPAPKARRRICTIIILCVAGAVVITAMVLGLVWLHYWPAHRFSVVQKKVIYRGAQPSFSGMEHILGRYGIRTDINLRGSGPGKDWWEGERQACLNHGVRMIDINMASRQTVVSGIREFLAVATDPANSPIYVHCEHGRTRTGYAVAAYRIVVQGWTYDRAAQEAVGEGLEPQSKLNPDYLATLRKLAAGADWRKLEDLPAEASSAPSAAGGAANAGASNPLPAPS